MALGLLSMMGSSIACNQDKEVLNTPTGSAAADPGSPADADMDAQAALAESENIFAALGLTLENEHAFITDAQVYEAFERAYAVLGTMDPNTTGWKVVVRDSDNLDGAATEMLPQFRRCTINIAGPLADSALAHEAVHVLMGRVTYEDILPGFVSEFMASNAEDGDPSDKLFDYQTLNREFFQLPYSTKKLGRESAIGSNPMPVAYDGFRYTLLRAASREIGQEESLKLTRELFALALEENDTVPINDLKPVFERHGLQGLVLFGKGHGPGQYVDCFIDKEGSPFIFYKQIDDQGYETSFPADMRIVYLKNGRETYGSYVGTTPDGIWVDGMGDILVPWADGMQVVIGGTTHAYSFIATPDGKKQTIPVLLAEAETGVKK
ncbi:MAG: hypothetical protein ABIG66_05645 [Candidatus Kerfeldbacteria bacterium]